ncbi:venom carboxylesterase-6-like [Bicyclus anynana]|uniref:Venom carboxylesterase-6-like n=1 Tax=Bicyclus anynana TaxID=110368 RepID=A0A6J1MI00_BICAN|nr:venom carboxylesterase-6-like [Bicyclus anynana]
MCAYTVWLFLCVCALAYAQEELRVNTTQGVVVGQRVQDGDYLAFFGIHYGGDTSGENRFKAPTPPPIYSGDFYAVNNTTLCAQPSSSGIIGTEDCLVLNIHTKNLATPKPVIVWIDGEEYASTGNFYPFKNLVEQDLVVVSMNYRLSIFGFLCLGVTDAPGNAGLKDIIQGLKWIKENIAGFGGDPNNVVLFGHGSGAALVDLITLSPMSTNLTHKAIVISGSGLSPWAVSYNPVGSAQRVGDRLGHPDTSRKDLAKKLASTDIRLLSPILRDFESYDTSLLFAPCVENADLNPSDTFLANTPISILKSGNYNKIPYMTGFVDREGTLRTRQVFNGWLHKMNKTFTDFIPVDLSFETDEIKEAVSRNVSAFYFDQKPISMNTIEEYLNYHGDVLILVPVLRGAHERARTSEDVWLFKFTYRGTQNSDWEYPEIPLDGARHGAILNFVFNYDLKPVDSTATVALTERFRAFAYTGIPNRPSDKEVLWEQQTPTRRSALLIGGGEPSTNVPIYEEASTINLNQETAVFWDDLFTKYYVPPSPVSAANSLLSFGLVVLIAQVLLKSFY